jgi:uncharacterized protein (DUF58 family)
MPAARVFVAAGIATLLLAFAAVERGFGVAALALDAAVLAAFLIDRRRAQGVRLRAERTWPPLLTQGAPVHVELRIALDTPWRRPVTLVAREALHPGLAERPLRRRLVAAAGREAVWRYTLVPRRRGEHAVGPLSVRVLGPWGLAWSQRDLVAPESRRVYPQVRWEGAVGRLLALAHRRELGRVPLRRHGAGSEPYALREYRPGDPPTHIHWKATARRGRLIAREDTWERGGRVVVLLDCARGMASRDDARSKLDHALAAALALARVAVGRGDRVTLVAFAERVERVVRVHAGQRGLARAYSALYDLEGRLCEPAYDLAVQTARSVEPRRATLVLMTSVVDLAAADNLREALAGTRRRRVLLVNLEDADLARLALGVPASPEEAFAKVSSLEILLANRRLGRRLARAGIRVASAPADRLAWETLEGYLDLARGRSARAGVTAAAGTTRDSGRR